MAVAELQVLQELATDESLQPLLQDQFDPKAFATHTIQCQVVGEMLHKLANGITELDNELYSQVVTHYEDLLSQATGIEALESVLKMMQSRIDSLTTAVDRISTKIIDPYQKIISRTAQLTRLQAACDLLRKVIRMLYLIKRIKTQMQGGVKEITKVAQTFNEIDQLIEGDELAGIEVIDEEKPWLQRAKREVETQAKKMLIQGLENLNPTHVGVALQVFSNLGQLEVTLVTILTSYREAVQHEIQNAVDPTTLLQSLNSISAAGRSTSVSSGSSSWKASLWTRLEKLSNALMKLYKQINQLEVVLSKKRDPTTQISFLSSISGSESHKMLINFWDNITDNVAVEFSTAAKASSFLNQTFENDYPKLVRIFSDLLTQVEQLHSQSDSNSQSMVSFLHPHQQADSQTNSAHRQDSLLKAFSQFEKVYISRSFSRLSDSVSQLFAAPSRSLPREDELLSVVKLLGSELLLAGPCVPLTIVLANNAAKTIQLFNAKCEQLVITGKDSLQVSGPPNHSQLRNIAIVNILHQFQTLIQEHILSSTSVEEIGQKTIQFAIEQTHSMKVNIISLFVEEIKKVIEIMVASMHVENFTEHSDISQSSRRDSTDIPCSGFIREMLSFTARIFQEHFSHFICQEDIKPLLMGVARRTLEIYVRHVCLIRPLSEGGKMRITSDMAQIELALVPFCAKAADLGKPHQMVRSLRRFLFLAPDNFLSQPAGVGDIIPYSYILNFLFSQAPPDMKSPHQVQNWSAAEYSNWMDAHPQEKDRLAFIQATLTSFSKKIRDSEAPPIFRTMNLLLKQAMDS